MSVQRFQRKLDPAAVSILKTFVPKVAPGNVALAASYDYGPTENCRSWLLDTGCKYDLTTRASVPAYLQNSIMKAPMPITLSTANDPVSGDVGGQAIDRGA